MVKEGEFRMVATFLVRVERVMGSLRLRGMQDDSSVFLGDVIVEMNSQAK